MILGLSHVALSCADIGAAAARLATLGYITRFDAPGLENRPEKAPMLHRWRATHHIRAMAADGAMAVELLDHGGLHGAQSDALIPVFRASAPLPDWAPVAANTLPFAFGAAARVFRVGLGAYRDPVLGMTLLWAPSKEASGLQACLAPVDDLDAFAGLLSLLRFRAGADGLWSLMTPIPALQARLLPVQRIQGRPGWDTTPWLDAPGSACLALMARSSENELPGLQAAYSFPLTVNGQLNRIKMMRIADGPILELVDPQR